MKKGVIYSFEEFEVLIRAGRDGKVLLSISDKNGAYNVNASIQELEDLINEIKIDWLYASPGLFPFSATFVVVSIKV